MKTALAALAFAACALAQMPSTVAQPACGPNPNRVGLKVRLVKSEHTMTHPAPGKATVYFIHDANAPTTVGYPTTMIGIDGAWVGANKSSYFAVSVEPGEHHVCADFKYGMANGVEYAHFTAEAGKVYYFQTCLVESQQEMILGLHRVDSDEAASLVASLPLSVSTPKN